mmetsp:Transcript_34071/g.71682  ORF Transcript_34071/g.71682 Transcript_34071/m.71682 type:complete len:431 (+) Transcript_34071:797-2089(+)
MSREFIQRALLAHNGNDNHLQWRHTGGQHQPSIITVDHDHDTDGTRGQSPTRLPYNLRISLLILIIDIEHLSKVLSQVMRRRSLNGTTRNGNVSLDSRRGVSSGKLLLLRLHSWHHGNGQKLLIYPTIQIQRLFHHNIRILKGSMGRVSLLPQKFARAQERRGILELPSHDVGPLVQLERQVAMAANPIRKGGVHDRLGRRTHGNGRGQIAVAGLGHPRHLGCEAFDVILLLFQTILGYEHGKVGVLYVELANFFVEPFLNQFPYFVTPRTKNVTSRDIVVGNHFGQDDDIRVPHGEILFLLPFERQLRLSLLGLFFVLIRSLGSILVLGGDFRFGGFVASRTRGGDLAREGSFALLSKGKHGGLHADFFQELLEVSRDQGRAGIVLQGVGMNLVHLEQGLIEDQGDVLVGIVHHGQWTDAALLTAQLLQ